MFKTATGTVNITYWWIPYI